MSSDSNTNAETGADTEPFRPSAPGEHNDPQAQVEVPPASADGDNGDVLPSSSLIIGPEMIEDEDDGPNPHPVVAEESSETVIDTSHDDADQNLKQDTAATAATAMVGVEVCDDADGPEPPSAMLDLEDPESLKSKGNKTQGRVEMIQDDNEISPDTAAYQSIEQKEQEKINNSGD